MDKPKRNRTARNRAHTNSISATWSALRASVASGKNGLAGSIAPESLVRAVLELPPVSAETTNASSKAGHPVWRPVGERPGLDEGWMLKELACAREFNFELPADLSAGVWRMEQALCTLLGVERCVMLHFDEETGLYTSLTELTEPQAQPLGFADLGDAYLEILLGLEPLSKLEPVALVDAESAAVASPSVLQSHLVLENGEFIGRVAVAEKSDAEAFTEADQRLLDLVASYLASKVSSFMHMRAAQTTPYIQRTVLGLAERLITAVDQDAIITLLLDAFVRQLGFDACQYVGFNPENGIGEVLYESKRSATHPETIRVQSYSHAGLEGKRRPIREYANLVGLISSMARNRFYLHLNGKKLGNRSLGDVFGLRGLQSALLLPVVDAMTGEIRGTINLFKISEPFISDDSRDIARESVQLASQALSRAVVLEKALAMASSDELTGLINRRGYYQRFEAELERARRHQTPLCVALIDVDHFKRFNDNYGHLSGDLVLKALAELCTQNTRKSDVVCRFGGEEFAVLLPDTSLKSAVELMERVRHNVERLQVKGFHGEALNITISVGLAEVNTQPKASHGRTEISDALALADEQLYVAKNNGRNQVCYRTLEQDQNHGSAQQAG